MRQRIKLINKKEVAKDTMAFSFTKPEGFVYKAGQSIDLFHVNPPETDQEGNKRAFSLTSAPYEDTLMIATRMRDTAFKRVLKNLQLQAELFLDGPFGSFTLHKDSQKTAVFLTGGIGITPIHSMIKQASHEKLPHKLVLFYSNHTQEETAFLDELTQMQEEYPNFTFVPTMTQNNGTWTGRKERISKEMLSAYIPELQNPIYYICGPSGMVWTMTQILLNADVNEDNIRKTSQVINSLSF